MRGKDVMSNLNSLYARLGGEEGVIRLVKAYIEALKTLPGAQRLRSLYPEDLSKYELRMTEFLSTWLGGPALYQERHGMPMLRESHRSFAIDDGFHGIFLGIWNNPFNDIMFVFIHLREKVFIFKYDLFRFFIGKKFCRCCSETLNDIEQCSDRRRVLVAFQLGDKSLGKL